MLAQEKEMTSSEPFNKMLILELLLLILERWHTDLHSQLQQLQSGMVPPTNQKFISKLISEWTALDKRVKCLLSDWQQHQPSEKFIGD